ncbi:MAG: hypothetical protein SWH54_04635 [Thermodesulfobacteriota bacterium]|nr:hypothetical protein [Thermodesulfobacteriota bacterium]
MAWTVTFYPYNILESGTVDVTGDPDTGFPESRLYDRAVSLFWKDTVAEAKNFTADQGASGNLGVDFLAIPKHNFSGIAMQWQYSNDNFVADIHDAVIDWNQGDNSQIIKTLASPVTQRYWRVTLASMTNPKCSEIFMSKGYSFNALREGNPTGRDIDKVRWQETVGGVERSTKIGNKRKARTYNFWMSAAEYASLLTIKNYLNDYAKPFYFKDHKDNYYMARFDGMPAENFDHNTHTRVMVNIKEMI